jgi:serine/threonine-protein kinase
MADSNRTLSPTALGFGKVPGTPEEAQTESSGPLAPARVKHVMRQIADALAEAHGVGLIHRDIKPANVVVSNRGRKLDFVKVVDFGLVKDVRTQGAPSLSNAATLLGTPYYVSPEAITDPANVDARSDIYALGAVGYFLLTGGPFMTGRTLVTVCAAHLYEKPVPTAERLGRDVPRSLDALVLRCLEKDPANRPQTASDVVDALDAAIDVPAWTSEDARAAWERWPSRLIGSSDDGAETTPGTSKDVDAALPARSMTIDLSGR